MPTGRIEVVTASSIEVERHGVSRSSACGVAIMAIASGDGRGDDRGAGIAIDRSRFCRSQDVHFVDAILEGMSYDIALNVLGLSSDRGRARVPEPAIAEVRS
jgi:hypothetical protein